MNLKLMSSNGPDWFNTPQFSKWMHRGDRCGNLFPELSMPAIEAGFKHTGLVEIDIQFAADEPTREGDHTDSDRFSSRLMVHHDPNTYRTTGKNVDISQTPVSALKGLTLMPPFEGNEYDSNGRYSEQDMAIPVLDQVLASLESAINSQTDGHCRLNIEMKAHSPECCMGVMHLLETYFSRGIVLPSNIIISSKHFEVMAEMSFLRDKHGVEFGAVVSSSDPYFSLDDAWSAVLKLHEKGQLAALSLPLAQWKDPVGPEQKTLHDCASETGLKLFYYTPKTIQDLLPLVEHDHSHNPNGEIRFHGAFIDDSHTFL